MRIPLTRYGLREIVLGSLLCLAAGIVCAWVLWPQALVPAGAWVFLLSFFRDPERPCRAGPGELLSPADGTVADIVEVDAPVFLEGRALRIGVFMSVFSCHVNRAPAGGTVEMVQHFPGKYFDARDERSMTENEHNFIGLRMPDGRKVLVNQIAGLVARRIVCAVSPGDALAQGERFGMIKFGSRLELFVPLSDGPEARVEVGEKVKAGRDVLVAYADRPPAAV
ncbi:MAG: phosphatidylserine decarboxylase [Candidatus Brocadiia bacterium]|nr:phosphatidylserine decarboxylase [Candidatus Brocadiia bacterium]